MNIKQFPKKIKDKVNSINALVQPISNGKKDYLSILFDYMYCRLKFKITRDEYLKYSFYNFKNRYRKDFILDTHRKKYRNLTTPGFTHSKYIFYKRIRDLYSREIIVAPYCGEDEFITFLKKHKKIIIKPDKGSAGIGVEAVEYTDDLSAKQLFESITDERPMICEEFIKQHPDLNQLNPSSVNSIRLVSIMYENEVEIVSATLKIGLDTDSITDNLSRGGIGAQVDIATGIVTTFGKDFNFKCYAHHPYTGTQIIGFQIPHWDQAIALVKNAHKRLPQSVIFGWDVAITESGVDLVEANNKPGCRIMQVMDCVPKGQHIIPMTQKDQLQSQRANMRASYNYFEEF